MVDGSCSATKSESGEVKYFDKYISTLWNYDVLRPMLEERVASVISFTDELFQSEHSYLQNKLKGFPANVQLDLSRLIINGHSFGGSTAVMACVQDARFKACITTDAYFFPLKDEDFANEFHLARLPYQCLRSEYHE